MNSVSILVAEDHGLLREPLAWLLNRNPRITVVGTTGCGEEAVEMACTLRPRVVILDIHLKGMSGFEVTRRLRDQVPAARVPVLSMHVQWPIARQILQKGAWGYVTKTCPWSELTKGILQVAAGCRYLCKELREQLSRTGNRAEGIGALTPREMEVIQWIRHGASSREIAQRLGMAHRTVEAHRYNIFRKLKVGSSTALMELLHIYGMEG